MERVRCILCGSNAAKSIMELPDQRYGATGQLFRVMQCVHCGLIYENPRPSKDEIAQFYPSEYYEPRKSSFGVNDGVLENLRNFRRKIVLREKARKVERVKLTGRILDVGCASGDFLSFMKGKGWQTQGIEPSKSMCTYASTHYGLDVFHGVLEDAGLGDRTFDVITFWSVLEHLHDPLGTMREAARVLKPDGYVIVLVPNIESWEAKLLGKKWPHLDVPRHLVHFSPKTLTELIHKAQLQVEWISYSVDWIQTSHLDRFFYPRFAKYAQENPRSLLYLLYRVLNLTLLPLSWLSSAAKHGQAVIVYASKQY
jgi:2-polyprenyl-3-methyl-5-hydroxy-6-metoxy-1,4-benzoquinol methylase